MIKSNKEIKNNSLHHSSLLKPPIKCHFANVSVPALPILSERKNAPLEGLEPQSDIKLQIRCDLHLNWTSAKYLVILCNWCQTKVSSFVQFPGKQESFNFRGMNTVCWSM